MTRIAGIINNSVVDGPGLRTAIFFSGCRRHCKGCHNPEAQDFNYGKEYTEDDIDKILTLARNVGDSGITLTGGHPLEPENYEFAYEVVKKAKEYNLDVWLYTGYVFEQIPIMYMDLISLCDVVVDGPFVENLKSNDCLYRGSTNQRLINIKETFDRGEIVLWKN